MLGETIPQTSLECYLEPSRAIFSDLLGYKPEQTSLQSLNEEQWKMFCQSIGFNQSSFGIFLPRNQTAVIPLHVKKSELSLFHEYFGHGLYCEQSLQGRRLVSLEKELLEQEKQEFLSRKFTLEDVQKFRRTNLIFKELEELRRKNLGAYELFAVWTEYFLSREFGLRDGFERKYEFLEKENKEVVDSVINFSRQYGDLATFYTQGLARKITTERVKKLLEDIYGLEAVQNSRLILLTGSKKPFSDIDLFASSNYLQSIKNNWLDLVVFNNEDFERRIGLFEIQVTSPIMVGEFVAGNKSYLQQKRNQLQEQPITEQAVQYNLAKAEEQKFLASQFQESSEEGKIGLSYSETYLANALALKEGLRLFTKEELISHSRGEKFIELKGGIIKCNN
ncbi:MAG: hypothetical protein Q7S56_02785 [Nanoarchaeota archaeon]|nr:hypothetical protein [Nanoarchaeota archaeon]